MTRPSVEDVARVIWETSRADEGTISATGANHVARAVFALFEPETVTTAAELDALPVGSVVRLWWGSGGYHVSQVWERGLEGWRAPGVMETYATGSVFPDRPLDGGEHWTVLFRPTEKE